MNTNSEKKYAIRFGLGAIKAVGFNMIEIVTAERDLHGKFIDIYDFCSRLDAKFINKKSIEALAKSGSFDCFTNNRRQIFDSFDILSSYSNEKKNEASTNQMNLFAELLGSSESKPKLKNIDDWSKKDKLQKEFEAFGFFLNEHPLDDYLDRLRKRGVVFSDKIERDEFVDGNIVKMSGIVTSSKHRSSARGRFAYLSISDPFGIFEAMIFDEAIITNARDILVDGSAIIIECLIKKDDGGSRILVREVFKLESFIENVQEKEKPFEDIKNQSKRQFKKDEFSNKFVKEVSERPKNLVEIINKNQPEKAKQALTEIKIFIKKREAILAIKSFLENKKSLEARTKIFLIVEVDGNEINIELQEKYFVNEDNLTKLQNIFGVEKILAS